MPIRLLCPACLKRHELPADFAAKKVRCDCGEAIDVREAQALAAAEESIAIAAPTPSPPPPLPSSPPPEEQMADLEADSEGDIYALAEPAPSPPPPLPPVPPPPPLARERRDRERTLDAQDIATLRGDDEMPPWKVKLLDREFQRTAVGIACLIYGPLMVVITLAWAIFQGIGLGTLVDVVAAVCIAIGGRMILKRQPYGPAWAGLSAIILCFFAVAYLVIKMAAALLSLSLLRFVVLTVYLVVVYSVPIAIVAWCLREEQERQRKAEEFKDFD